MHDYSTAITDFSCHVYRKALLKCLTQGLAFGISQTLLFIISGYVLRFGAFLITLPESNVASADFSDILVTFIALLFGASGAGYVGTFSMDYSKARVSANHIFHMLDQVPSIDSYSQDKIELVCKSLQVFNGV